MTTIETPILITVEETGRLLQVSRGKAYQMAARSELPVVRMGKSIRVRRDKLDSFLEHYVGRPSPVYHAKRLSDELGGAQIYLKREDLNHTGAHKVNNTMGQALVARRMGKPRVIAETGAGQHGVATATVAARYGMECVVYMGTEDVARAQNVYRMKLLGATVVPVSSSSRTLKDALNEAMRDWVTNVANTFYIIGTVAGPHPYPMMVITKISGWKDSRKAGCVFIYQKPSARAVKSISCSDWDHPAALISITETGPVLEK